MNTEYVIRKNRGAAFIDKQHYDTVGNRYMRFFDRVTSNSSLSEISEFLRYFHPICKSHERIMHLICLTIASLTYANTIAADTARVNIDKYCRDKDRLITSEENDEYLLVGVETNTTIALACRYW